MTYNICFVYTYEYVSKGSASIQSALDILKDSDKHQCLNDIDSWKCSLDNKMFDLIKHSSIYCETDCTILMDGYEVFRSWMIEHTGLDIDHYITSQSLASDFMLKSGCYNNVFQISEVSQQYITRSVVGGSMYDSK